MGYPHPNSRIRAVDASRSAARSQIDPILRLQAAGRDDKAGVGYIRPISLDLALAIRTIFSGRGFDNVPRDEQKREYARGSNRIGGEAPYGTLLGAKPGVCDEIASCGGTLVWKSAL
jgi:hypothetical protein